MGSRPLLFAALACLLPLSSLSAALPDTPATTKKPAPDLSAEAIVVEQSEVIVHFARDGSSVRTWRMRELVQSDAGVRTVGIVSVPFAALTQTLTFDYVRVRKPSGQVVLTAVDGAQEVPLPVTQQAPMYSDLRMKQLPVQSLSAGDTLEYQVTLKSTNADAPGAFWYQANFTTGVPVQSETYEVAVPRDMTVLVKSKGTAPVVSDKDGERMYRWQHETASEYPKKQEKDNTAQVGLVQETYQPDIAVSSFQSWAEVGAWYRGLIRDRALPDAAIRAKADELTHGLTTDDAKVDALYNYVATQYRYIAVSFGIGRLQPHAAAEVFRNQYGDCKDKHTLLQAMLAAENITAVPMLVNDSLRVNEAIPMPAQFDHMITLVKLKDHDVWLDATPEIAPARVLMGGLRDKLALAGPPAGDAQLVRTPATLPFPSYVHQTIKGKLDAKGTLTAHFDLTLRGDDEVIYREVYHAVSRAEWQQAAQQISYNSGFAGEVSALDAGLPEKTGEPFHVAWDYTRKDYGDWSSRRFPGLTPWFEAKLADDATPPKRAIALDPTAEIDVKATIEVPEGYTVEVPADVRRTSPFAEYVSTYAMKGRTLEMDRTMRYKAREIPVSDFPAYRDFLKAVSDDAGQMLQLVGSEVKTAGAQKPDDAELHELLLQVDQKRAAHDINGARALLDQIKARNDHQTGLWVEYAWLAWMNHSEAIADYKKELEYHPENNYAYQGLTALYFQDGAWGKAEESLRSWTKADPADPRPHARLGTLQIAQKRYKEAEASLQQAITLSTEPDQFKMQLGQAQLKAGDTEAGKATLHALMDASNDPNVLNNTAYEFAEAGVDLPAAEAASRKAVAIVEQQAATATLANAKTENFTTMNGLVADWDTLGWILFKEQKLTEAEAYVRSAWLLSPREDIGEHMAAIEEAQGNRPAALTTYRQTRKLMTGNLPAELVDRKAAVEAKIAALQAARVKEKPGPKLPQGGDDLAALRTYTVPSPLAGQYASADFLFLMGDKHAEDVRFVKGDALLKKAAPALLAAPYRDALPSDSKAKILRRGIMACTTGSSTCMLVLLPAAEANLNDVVQ